MIVVEGMPGAGKTTLLGRLLSATRAVFPEAQPVGQGARALEGLLAEDAARLHHAAHLQARGLGVLSDRCYAGVLAYRHALATTGRTSEGPLRRAWEQVEDKHLAAGHDSTTVIVMDLDVATSLARRAAAPQVVQARFAEWFDGSFLSAYRAFWDAPERWAPPGATVRTVQAADHGAVEALADSLSAAAPATTGRALGCESGCGAPRSPVVSLPGGDRVQLAARGLHRASPGARAQCLREAARVAQCWGPVRPPRGGTGRGPGRRPPPGPR